MKNQRGVSLITVFFIMTIILSVVLSLSALLFSELKNSTNTEDSIIAFYAADSGIEKFLYFNRKQLPSIPPGVTAGMCAMGDSCPDCLQLVQTGEDCTFCKNCEVSYTTTFDNKKYDTTARIVPNGSFYNIDVSAKGFYKDTSRAIGLQIVNKDLSSSAPTIQNVSAIWRQGSNLVDITAVVIDPDGVDEMSIKAHIRNSTNPSDPDAADPVPLSRPNGIGDTYIGSQGLLAGYYYVYVRACDMAQLFENCGESVRVPITGQ